MALPLTDEQLSETRERIRRVAERLIARDGPDGVSLRTVASELGWTAASLYRYFPGKAGLIDSVRTAAYARFSERMETALASSADLWQRSRAIGDAYIAFAADEPAAYQLIFAYGQDNADKSDELKEAEARSWRMLTGYVRDMVEAGLLEGDPELIAHAWWATMHGLIVLRMAGKLDNSPGFDTLRHGAMRLITRGARPGGRPRD